MDNINRKYPVNTAVWIATALLSLEVFESNPACSKRDMYFKQKDIVQRAQMLAEGNVVNARCSQWCCADNYNSSNNYLRGDLQEDNSLRRLSCLDEFSDKTYPEELNMSDELIINDDSIRIDKLFNFIMNQYPKIIGNEININYIGVLNYLRDNIGVKYSDPNNPEISVEEKSRLLEVKQKGQAAVAELKKMAEAFAIKYKLDKCLPIKWLDGTNTKTGCYLWTQLKYKKYEDSPISISIFVERSNENDSRYRISMEIKNNGTHENVMNQYHKHLEIPLNTKAGLVYVSGSNELGIPKVINKPQDEIKQDIEMGKIDKVQVCKYVERKADETNLYYHTEISKAIKELIPYYEHVLEVKDDNISKYTERITGADRVSEERGVFQEMKQTNKIEFDKNLILYGPPGTGKTYNSVIYAVAICDGKSIDELTDYDIVLKRYNELKKLGRIAFTTFHQSYGYEEFIEGIKPVVNENKNDIGYIIQSGIFKKFCEKAKNNEPYVFIIDEINRGNISKIFGELITLIENTKRAGMLEAASAVLPYSNEEFSVPNNVYILGTMNTADRSIALMDTALRRRFKFVEMMPNAQVLRDIGSDKIYDGDIELDVAHMLETINQRIEYLYDREHTIGHAFFTELKDHPTVSKLADIFKKSVVPLLQEYFYEDYSKIMLVLGDNGKEDDKNKFILATEIKVNSIFKGDTSEIDIPDYSYEIQDEAFENIMSYVEITT